MEHNPQLKGEKKPHQRRQEVQTCALGEKWIVTVAERSKPCSGRGEQVRDREKEREDHTGECTKKKVFPKVIDSENERSWNLWVLTTSGAESLVCVCLFNFVCLFFKAWCYKGQQV